MPELQSLLVLVSSRSLARATRTCCAAAFLATGLAPGAMPASAAPASRVTGTVRIGSGPVVAVTYVGGAAWGATGTTIARVTPAGNRVARTIHGFHGHIAGMVGAAGRVWAWTDAVVFRINPASAAVTGRIDVSRLGYRIRDVAVTNGRVLVLAATRKAQAVPQRLPVFDATTLRVMSGYLWPPSRIPLHATSISVPSRYALVFATSTPPYRLSRYSQSNLSSASITLGTSLRPLVQLGGAWTGTATGLAHVTFAGYGGNVGPITLDGRAVSTAPLTPTAVALGLGSLWVSAATGNAHPALARANPTTGALVGDPLPLPARGRAVSVGGGAVWVGTAAGSVVRVRPQP